MPSSTRPPVLNSRLAHGCYARPARLHNWRPALCCSADRTAGEWRHATVSLRGGDGVSSPGGAVSATNPLLPCVSLLPARETAVLRCGRGAPLWNPIGCRCLAELWRSSRFSVRCRLNSSRSAQSGTEPRMPIVTGGGRRKSPPLPAEGPRSPWRIEAPPV